MSIFKLQWFAWHKLFIQANKQFSLLIALRYIWKKIVMQSRNFKKSCYDKIELIIYTKESEALLLNEKWDHIDTVCEIYPNNKNITA